MSISNPKIKIRLCFTKYFIIICFFVFFVMLDLFPKTKKQGGSHVIVHAAGRRDARKDTKKDHNEDPEKKRKRVSLDDFDDHPEEDKSPKKITKNKKKSKQKLTADKLLKEVDLPATNELKVFEGETLGYVTPWNSKGYDVAKDFRLKFDYISPVWYQIRRSPDTQKLYLAGGHDADESWLNEVRYGKGCLEQESQSQVCTDGSDGPSIVPRVILEIDSLDAEGVVEIATILIQEALTKGYNGYVFELPIAPSTGQLLQALTHYFSEMGIKEPKFILVSRPERIPADLLKALSPFVHRFMIMTYDFAKLSGKMTGPNSPIDWVEDVLTDLITDPIMAKKILMGIPFYGWDGHEAVVHHDFKRKILQNDVTVEWMEDAKEHLFFYRDGNGQQHSMTYPTVKFLEERLQLAKDMEVGVAIWEIGQGLDYFTDLF